jgi:tetratricopeptide (TPR) repeat protein
MSLKDQIKAILQEAEIYRRQGLLEEARSKYKEATDLIQANEQLRNRDALIQAIGSKVASLDSTSDALDKEEASPQLSPKAQDLIKKLFSFSEKKDRDEAALEGAIALAKFGQFDGALQEFKTLIERDTHRLVAAKNILRCHFAVNANEAAVDQLKEWQSGDLFSPEQLTGLRASVADHLARQGVEMELPEIESAAPAAEGDFSAPGDMGMGDDDQGEFLDITSIGITMEAGPSKGQMVEFDVNFQSGNMLSLIIPSKDEPLIAQLQDGVRLDNIQYYSPIAIFKGAGVVASRTQIKNGPKKGDFCLDVKIVNQ